MSSQPVKAVRLGRKADLPQLSGVSVGPAPGGTGSASFPQPTPNSCCPEQGMTEMGSMRLLHTYHWEDRLQTHHFLSLPGPCAKLGASSAAIITSLLKCPLSLLPQGPSQAPILPVHLSLVWMKVSDTRNTKQKRKNNWKSKACPDGESNNS